MRTTLLSCLLVLAALVPGAALAAEPEQAFDYLDEKTLQYFVDKGVLAQTVNGTVAQAPITRAEFVQAVVEYVYPSWAISEHCLQGLDTDKFPGVSYTLLFRDVSKDESYALHLCAAMRGGIVWGYGDGNFRPNDTINLAEAAKVMSIAFNLDYQMPMYQRDDWYATYLQTLRRYTTFPESVRSPGHTMTVGETRAMLQNVSERTASYHGSRVNGKLDTALMSSMRVQHVSTLTAQQIRYSSSE